MVSIVCSFHLLVSIQPLCADRQVLFELVASEGISLTEYHSDSLNLEPHEFPEFNHEIGMNFYMDQTFNWFGIGGCFGLIYNLNGAFSVMHFDIGVYGSFFLVGEKYWKDHDSGIDETVKPTNQNISHDVGIRARLFIDIALFRLKKAAVELGGGLGFVVEKSIMDISKESSEEMNSFRVGACITVPILLHSQPTMF